MNKQSSDPKNDPLSSWKHKIKGGLWRNNDFEASKKAAVNNYVFRAGFKFQNKFQMYLEIHIWIHQNFKIKMQCRFALFGSGSGNTQ